MKILMSNDDGVFAKGLAVLHDIVAREHDVTVV
ncbi:MAG TPA: 5'/3'-nucleotidase SurE, partial [Alteromonas australica]|nr:5'/3'-nucleotidase SurE [Alteromonas australica]